jgi:dihydroorotate dehydrogenase
MFRRFAGRSAQNFKSTAPRVLTSSFGSKLTTFTAGVGAVGAVGFYYYKDPNAAIHEYVILPTIRLLLDGENSHRLAIETFKYPWLNPKEKESWNDTYDPNRQLAVTLFANSKNPKVKPVTLRTPIGIAAGLDKNGEAIETLYNLGFPYVEIGSITPLAQPGNPRPRFFRLEKDLAVINNYGFNSQGQAAVLARLKVRMARAGLASGAVGQTVNNSLRAEHALAVSLGKNKHGDALTDYAKGVQTLGPYADILVVNISSPNTPGLRDLQAEESLKTLLSTVVRERNKLDQEFLPPVVVKVSPDLTEPEVESIAAAVKATDVDGVIISN